MCEKLPKLLIFRLFLEIGRLSGPPPNDFSNNMKLPLQDTYKQVITAHLYFPKP